MTTSNQFHDHITFHTPLPLHFQPWFHASTLNYCLSSPIRHVSFSVSHQSIMSSLAAPSQALYAGPLNQDQFVVDTPLVISSALLPVPGNLVKKVQSGMFVDMKEILSDSVALLQRLGEISSSQIPHNPCLRGSGIYPRYPLTWVKSMVWWLYQCLPHYSALLLLS